LLTSLVQLRLVKHKSSLNSGRYKPTEAGC